MTTEDRKPTTRSRRTDTPAKARPVTASYLRNAALHYLSGRSASSAMVRATLVRRAKRRLVVKSLGDEHLALIEGVIGDLTGLGLIDDATFAEARARSLAGRGLSRRRIAERLALKGIKGDLAAGAIEQDLDELSQARLLVRRRRLGSDPARRDRDLRALARAGFGYAIAIKALAGDDAG